MATFLIYDGECPFCSRYADFAVAKQRVPDLQMLDARGNRDHPAVQAVHAKGLVLDEGMALVFADGRVLHGPEVLPELAAPRGFLSSSKRANWAYPWLRGMRNTVLRVLGRKKIGF